jgi:hypothetical protein
VAERKVIETWWQNVRSLKRNELSADELFRQTTVDLGAVRKWEHLMPSLEHLIYASLTGMLLHCDRDGSFFQVLEGESAATDQLFQKILRDERHSHVTLIIREPIAERSFGDWSMGFSSVSPEKLRKVPGLNDFFQKGLSFRELDAGRAKKLLIAFSEGRWRPQHLGAKWTAA